MVMAASASVVASAAVSQPMKDAELQGSKRLFLIGPESGQKAFTTRGRIREGLRILRDVEKGVIANRGFREHREAVCANSGAMFLSTRGRELWEAEIRKAECWENEFNQCWVQHVRACAARNVDPDCPEEWRYQFRPGLTG